MGKKVAVKPPTNQQLVAVWLKRHERNWSYIARHINMSSAVLTKFKRGGYLRPETVMKIKKFTGLPLQIPFKGCETIISDTEIVGGGKLKSNLG